MHNESSCPHSIYVHMKPEHTVAKCQESQNRFIALIPQILTRVVATLILHLGCYLALPLSLLYSIACVVDTGSRGDSND